MAKSEQDVLTIQCWPQLRRALEYEVASSCLGGTPEDVARHLLVMELERRRIERQKKQ